MQHDMTTSCQQGKFEQVFSKEFSLKSDKQQTISMRKKKPKQTNKQTNINTYTHFLVQ